MRFFKQERPHQSLGYRTPMALTWTPWPRRTRGTRRSWRTGGARAGRGAALARPGRARARLVGGPADVVDVVEGEREGEHEALEQHGPLIVAVAPEEHVPAVGPQRCQVEVGA